MNELRRNGLIDANMGNQQNIEQVYRNILLNNFMTRRGTPEDVINALRTEIYNDNDNNNDIEMGDNNERDRSCAICLAPFDIGEQLRFLPCQHSFHSDCIDQWLRGHRTCPMCRIDITAPR